MLVLDLAGVPAGPDAAQLRLRVAMSRESTLQLDLAGWLGRLLTDAEKMASHRALAALERAGLVRRLKFGFAGRRTTHIRLLDVQTEAA